MTVEERITLKIKSLDLADEIRAIKRQNQGKTKGAPAWFWMKDCQDKIHRLAEIKKILRDNPEKHCTP
jgi:hypothetical protein